MPAPCRRRDALRRGRCALAGMRQRAEVGAIGLVRDSVEAAPSGSLLLHVFAALMAGPLRQPVLRFYAQASEGAGGFSLKARARS